MSLFSKMLARQMRNPHENLNKIPELEIRRCSMCAEELEFFTGDRKLVCKNCGHATVRESSGLLAV